MAQAKQKTNAMRLLDGMGAAYTMHTYTVEDGAIDGPAVAAKTGQNPARVYKTLVAEGASGAVAVFCIPVEMQLDLKAAARAAGEKSVAMLPLARVTPVTGYVRGGVSPLGMKKAYPFFLWHEAAEKPAILVSGGRPGTQIELAPQLLLQAAKGTLFGESGKP